LIFSKFGLCDNFPGCGQPIAHFNFPDKVIFH
jgi:hypothetical protein